MNGTSVVARSAANRPSPAQSLAASAEKKSCSAPRAHAEVRSGAADQPPQEHQSKLAREMARDSVARGLYRQRLKPALARLRNLRPYSIANTIVMSGTPRGGTSWLAEILATLPKSSLIWEPLDLEYTEEAARLGLDWRTYVPASESRPALEEFFGRVLTGRVRNPRINNAAKLREILEAETFIVKFIRGQMLLGWLDRHLRFAKPAILLIRHPCAVVSSQLRWGEWGNMKTPRFASVLSHYPEFEEILAPLDTLEQKLAAMWAMEYRVALDASPCPFLVVTYEELVRDGEAQVERIFAALGHSVPPDAFARLRRPSRTATADSHVAQAKDPLTGWTGKLSRRQVREILDVVAAFGIDFYGDALEPDYRRLELQLGGDRESVVVPSSRARPELGSRPSRRVGSPSAR